MKSWHDLLSRLRDALIAYVPPDAPVLPSVTVREEAPPPQPIPPEWVRKNDTVKLERLSLVMRSALPKLAEARRRALDECLMAPLVITSAAEGTVGDGVHSAGSLHYLGRAVDLRITDFAQALRRRAAELLGSEYDVILEDVEEHRCSRCGHVDGLGPHGHAEHDP